MPVKHRNIYDVLRSLGWWLATAESCPDGPAGCMLAGRWHDLCVLVAEREGVSNEEADALLMDGYLQRWIKQRVHPGSVRREQ